MFRIGIIGSENSHAKVFSELFNTTDRYPDMRVVGIFGEDEKESLLVSEKYGVEFVASHAEEMLGRVDAMMITSRNGALHSGYARPYIEAGLPIFIDKPIANDGGEAYEILRLAKAKGVPVMGGTSVKFLEEVLALKKIADTAREEGKLLGGHVWAPVQMENEYGNFYFYSSHLIEVAMTIFGYAGASVEAMRSPAGVGAVLRYEGFTVHLSYLDNTYSYGATVLTAGGAHTSVLSLDSCFALEAEAFVQMLRHGTMPHTIEQLALPVFALNAIHRAYETGATQAYALPSA